MGYFVSKILQEFAYPFNLALVCLAFGLWSLRKTPAKWGRRFIAIALAMLVVPGLAVVHDPLLASLERYYPAKTVEETPSADAIVVLGGTTVPTQPPRLYAEEVGGSRLLHVLRLYKAGKSPLVLTTGGSVYQSTQGEERSESVDMAEILTEIGVPASVIIREAKSRNTYENALFSAELLRERGVKKIILVTSAFHQRRAVALFAKQGFEVIPAPTGHLVVDSDFNIRQLLPSADGISHVTTCVKEYLGFFAYRLWGRL